MTTKEFVALEKQLLPGLAGFVIHGSLMLLKPVESLVRGISFDGSSFDKSSFSVTEFVMPLCVPAERVYLNFGKRIRQTGGGDRWSAEKPDLIPELRAALEHQVIPKLSGIASLPDFVELAGTFSGNNMHTPRAIAFALARAGETRRAVEMLDSLLEQLDARVAWQGEIANQASSLKSKLLESPAKAQEQLAVWEAQTAHNLGLGHLVERVRPVE